MQIPQIRMQQTFVKLGLNIQKPVQEIRQPQGELNMRQEAAILEINQGPGQLVIDSSEARRNIDLKGPLERTRDNADYAARKTMEAIEFKVQSGDRLAAIENKGNPIADISFEESIIYQGGEIIAAGSLVGDGIEITYQPRKTEINWEVRGVKTDPKINKPVHEYTPGKVEKYIERWNSLTIDFVPSGQKVDISV